MYVSPAAIEKKLQQSPLIRQAWIYGHNRDHLVAIVVPDCEEITYRFPESKGTRDVMQLLKNEEINNELLGEIKKYNSLSRSPDQIINCAFVTDEWSAENGLLTSGNQPDRLSLLKKYELLILSLYS